MLSYTSGPARVKTKQKRSAFSSTGIESCRFKPFPPILPSGDLLSTFAETWFYKAKNSKSITSVWTQKTARDSLTRVNDSKIKRIQKKNPLKKITYLHNNLNSIIFTDNVSIYKILNDTSPPKRTQRKQNRKFVTSQSYLYL